jgi:hypothetical protein
MPSQNPGWSIIHLLFHLCFGVPRQAQHCQCHLKDNWNEVEFAEPRGEIFSQGGTKAAFGMKTVNDNYPSWSVVNSNCRQR